MSATKLSRREFLYGSAMAAVGVALTACGGAKAPEASPVPTAKPAVSEPTAIPTQAATATPVPEAAAAQEAPALAELVKAGKLPPLADRLPTKPLVLSPIDEIGQYGGRIRSYSGWLGGLWEESQYGHSALRWIDDGMGIAPGMCEAWETNADNTEWTLHWRKGLKWSDGQPCTVDDTLAWWNEMVIPGNAGEAPPDFGSAGGELVEFIKVDEFTLKLKYIEPAPLTAKRLAMWVNGNIGPRWILPWHYMKQFHPKFNSEMKDWETWSQKILFRQNPDCPSLDSWICTQFTPGQSIKWDRNPYYYAVDTKGNQLPYIDGVDETQIQDAEVRKLTIMQGGTDFQNFSDVTLADVAVLMENESKGDYQVRFWDTGSGTGMMFFWNYDSFDAKKRALYRNPKFKQAMSHALDRKTIQTIVYYNTGILTTGSMSPKAIEFNYNDEAKARYAKIRDAYVAYDVAKAKALLAEAGLKQDANGKWTYGDGAKLEVRVDLQADAGKECLDVLQIAQKNWEAVGLNIVINQMPPSEFGQLWFSGKAEFRTNWEVGDGPDHMLYPSWVVPNERDRWAPLCGQRLAYLGTDKENSEKDKSPWDREPPRFNADDPEFKGTPIEKLQEIYERCKIEVDELKRMSMVWEMNDIHINDGPFFIGTVANTPRPIIVSNKLTNVPTREQLKLGGFVNPWIIPYPAVTNPETYSFKPA